MTILLFIIIVALDVALDFWRAYVAWCYYYWFVIPNFAGAPHISLGLVLPLILLFGLIKGVATPNIKDEDLPAMLVKMYVNGTVLPLIYLIIGALLK